MYLYKVIIMHILTYILLFTITRNTFKQFSANFYFGICQKIFILEFVISNIFRLIKKTQIVRACARSADR